MSTRIGWTQLGAAVGDDAGIVVQVEIEGGVRGAIA